MHRDHVEPVVQVLTEAASGHLLLQIPVGGGDDAGVHGQRLDAPQPEEGPVLEHGKQLYLELKGKLSDLVQEHGAPVAQLKDARLAVLVGSGEGSRLVAEEFRLQQIVRGGSAGDLYKGFVRAGELVNHAAEHVLAHPRLTGDEDGGLDAADAVGQLRQPPHLSAFPHNVAIFQHHLQLLQTLVELLAGLLVLLDHLVVAQVAQLQFPPQLGQVGHVPQVGHDAPEGVRPLFVEGEDRDHDLLIGVRPVAHQLCDGLPCLEHFDGHPGKRTANLDQFKNVSAQNTLFRESGHLAVGPIHIGDGSRLIGICEAVVGGVQDLVQHAALHQPVKLGFIHTALPPCFCGVCQVLIVSLQIQCQLPACPKTRLSCGRRRKTPDVNIQFCPFVFA